MAIIGPNISFQSIGPAGFPDIGTASGFFVIQSPWGLANTPVAITSVADFVKNFGGLNKLTAVASGLTADTYTVEQDDDVVQGYYAVKAYLEEKGQDSPGVAFVSRVIQTASPPTAASKTFPDNVGSNNTTITAKWVGRDGGTVQAYTINPSPRRGIFALQAGTVAVTSGTAAVTGNGTTFQTGSTWVGWGIKIGVNYYTILSVATSTSLTLAENAAATETVAVYSVGTNTDSTYINLYHPQSNIREEWDLLPTTQSAADISRRSQLATIALPAGLQLPKTSAPGSAGAVKLNSGSAATADSYAATASDYVGAVSSAGVKTGIQVFNDLKYGTGWVMCPGQVSASVRTGIAAHAATYYRVGLYCPSSGLVLNTAQTEFAGISSNLGAGYVPRVWVTATTGTGSDTVLVDPTGHVAGLGARMQKEYGGPHKSPAGITHPLLTVVDLERQSNGMELYDDAGSGVLADNNVNTIRFKANGYAVYGMRTFASDERYRQINQALLVCVIYHASYNLMQKVTFEPIDSFGNLFGRVKGDLDSMLYSLWRAGSLYGTQPGKQAKPDNAWFVVCDRGNNPNTQVGKGILRADVSFAGTPNAERIDLPIFVAAPGFGAAAAGVF